jgi:anti-sigma B factor antagonist
MRPFGRVVKGGRPFPALRLQSGRQRRYNARVTAENSKLQIAERRIDDVTLLELSGELTLDDGELAFRSYIHTLLDEGHRKILLDLGRVGTVDSAGVGMLVAKLKTIRDHGGDMKLLHMTPRTSRVFGMMKIRSMFESFDDESLAVKSFASDVRS